MNAFTSTRREPIQVLMVKVGAPLVLLGGGSLHELREDAYDAARATNGRANVHSIEATYDTALMGGEPYAEWF